MKRKAWCVYLPKKHPLLVGLKEKYLLSDKDAKSILTAARREDQTLENDDITLEYLEQTDAFKKALAVYTQKIVDVNDAMFKATPGRTAKMQEEQKYIKEILGRDATSEEIEEMAMRMEESRGTIRDSKLSSANLAAVTTAFKDARRMQYIGDLITRIMSDTVTNLSTSPELREAFGKKYFQNRQRYFTDPSSFEFITDQVKGTLGSAMERLRQEGKTELAEELHATLLNFDSMLYMYGSNLFREEGISVLPNGTVAGSKSDNSSAERNDIDTEEKPDDGDEEGESPVNSFSESDQHRSVTSKIVPDIKLLLSNIREVNAKYKDKEDPYGYHLPVYLNVPHATNKLLFICKGCRDYADMVEALQKNQKSTPWIKQLLSALDTAVSIDPTTGNKVSASRKEQLQSMFFKSMRKQFTTFATSYTKYNSNGDMLIETRDANVRHKYDTLLKKLNSKFFRGTGLAIMDNGAIDFSEKGIRGIKSSLDSNNPGSFYINLLEAQQLANKEARKGNNADYSSAFEKLAQAEKQLMDILVKYGIEATPEIMEDYTSNDAPDANYTEFYGINKETPDLKEVARKYTRLNSLHGLLNTLTSNFINWRKDMVTKTADGKKVTTDDPYSNPMSLSKEAPGEVRSPYRKKIRGSYIRLVSALTEFSPDSFESRTRISGKDYYCWNNPTSVQSIIEGLTERGPKKVQEYIKSKYMKDAAWFLKPESTDKKPAFYSEWLQNLYDNAGGQVMEYVEKPSFCGTGYGDMSDVSYSLSMLNDYFLPTRGQDDIGTFRMLIASDKPRYGSIRFKKYNDRTVDLDTNTPTKNNYHVVIRNQAEDFFSQELSRCIRVVRHAVSGDGIDIKDYDIKLKGKAKDVINKIKEGKKIKPSDVVENGRYIFRNSGASFFLNKFINDEIEKAATEEGSALGEYVVDLVFNKAIKNQDKNLKLVTPKSLAWFRDGFDNYMQSIRDSYFKRLQEDGMFEERTMKATAESGETQHLKYLLGSMKKWHENDEGFIQDLYSRDKEARQIGLEYFGFDINEKEYASYTPMMKELAQFREDLEEFVYNNWYAKANMSQIFDVDLAFYGNTTNFQKRNAQVVSSGYPVDKDAKVHGQLVSDGTYRTITLKTVKVPSKQLSSIQKILDTWYDVVKDKYPEQAEQFKKSADSTIEKLKKLDSTDGQGLTSLTGLRKKLVGQADWTRSDSSEIDDRDDVMSDEAVYRRIKKGKVTAEDLLHVFAQPQKPFVYTFENMQRDGQTITVPVQHKNSEYCLAYLSAFISGQKPESQMAAIAKFMEDTAVADSKTGIDGVNFDSVVKIGSNSKAIDIEGLTPQETYEKLLEATYGDKNAEKIKDNYKPGVVTEYDCRDYKIQQVKPEHFKDSAQPMGTQLKILAINNIHDNTECTLPDGSKINGKELKRRYFDALRRKMRGVEQNFRYEMGINMPAAQRRHKLSLALKRALSTDQKFTAETRRALSIIDREGVEQFVLPLDDPGMQGAVESMLYSKIRRTYYKEKTNGGIVVQATSWGSAEDLHIRFYSNDEYDIKNRGGLLATYEEFEDEHDYGAQTKVMYDKYVAEHQTGYAHFEAEVPMPDYVRDMLKDSNGKVQEKFLTPYTLKEFAENRGLDPKSSVCKKKYDRYIKANPKGYWNMDEIRKVVPESVFDAICYRVPTEAKYSMMVCKIVRFAPELSGSVAKYPKELTEFTGSDFDIDTDTIELRPGPAQRRSKDVDNEIFDLQLAALRSNNSIQETFKSGDFSDLSEASYYIMLLERGYDEKELDKMTTDQLKALCEQEEDMDLMNPSTDVVLHRQNSDAKDMIAIAAVGVTSHAFLSLYNDVDTSNPQRDPQAKPENFVRVYLREGGKGTNAERFSVVNDVDPKKMKVQDFSGYTILDPMYNMDDKLVSTEISKYVGAAADAAKDAALFRLNLTKETLPIAITMHRLGVSSDVIRMFISQPIIKEAIKLHSQMASFDDASLTTACKEVRQIITFNTQGRRLSDKDNKEWQTAQKDQNKTLVYSVLRENKKHKLEDLITNEDTRMEQLRVLSIFETLSSLQESISNLDSFTRYNSPNAMKGSSFLDRYARQHRITRLKNNLSGEKPRISLPKDVEISDDFEMSEYGRLCSMFPYVGHTIEGESELADDIILENMQSYGAGFFESAKRFQVEDSAEELKKLYAGWKNYLLFVGDNRIADFRDEKTVKYYTRDYADNYFAEIEKIKSNNPKLYDDVLRDNEFIQEITAVAAKDGYGKFAILSTDVSGMNGPKTEKFKADWEALLRHPETRRLATDTAIHFLARSAAFSRDTPVHVMPLAVKEAIPNYIKAFADAGKNVMSERQLDEFRTLYALNNIDDTKIVPHLYQKATKTTPLIYTQTAEDEKGNQFTLIKVHKDHSYAISKWLDRPNDESLLITCPIVTFALDYSSIPQVFMLTAPEVEQISEGKDDYYVLQAVQVNPRGIPQQISEYSTVDDTVLLDPDSEPNPDEASDEAKTETPPVSYDEISTPENFRRSGTYLYDSPYGEDNVKTTEDLNQYLAKDSALVRSNSFLESRTHLRRAGKLIKAMGLRLTGVNRTSSSGKPTYEMNLSPSDYTSDQHLAAVQTAALISSLGYQKGTPAVKTYVQEDEDFNCVEFAVPLVENVSKKQLANILKSGYVYNQDRNEVLFTIDVPIGNDVSAALEYTRREKDDIERLVTKLYDEGLAETDELEVNFALRDVLTSDKKKAILTDLIKKQNGTESKQNEQGDGVRAQGTDSQNDGRGQTDQARKEIGIGDLAKLALRRENGERVDDELKSIFNEDRRQQLQNSSLSYQSRALADSVLSAFDEYDLYSEVSALLNEKATKNVGEGQLLDNLIINAANWIRGNKSEEALSEMLSRSGFVDESADNIITIIKEKLKELNIC